MPFSGPAPLKLKKKLRVGYVYIAESFDTIFNMGYWGGGPTGPPYPMHYASGKSPMLLRVNNILIFGILFIFFSLFLHFFIMFSI